MDTIDLSKLDPAILATLPAMMPPPGVTPNFVNPKSLAPAPAIVIYVTFPLMVLFLLLRVYARFRIGHSFGADDLLCFVSFLCVTGYTAVILSMLGNPMGPHQWNVPLSKIDVPFLTKSLLSMLMYILSAMWIKITLLVLYLRLFKPSPRANLMIWGGIVLCVLFYTACVVVSLVQCVPVSNSLPTSGHFGEKDTCGQPQLNLSAGQGVFSAVTDFYVLVIPVSLVLELRLPLKRKIGVSAIFLTGLLAVACSVASSVYRFKQRTSSDYTWDSVSNYALGAAELNVGLICACLPVVFVLFKKSAAAGPWASFMRYISTRRSRHRSSRKHSADSNGLPHHMNMNIHNIHHASSNSDLSSTGEKSSSQGNMKSRLPKIPSATITGLRTFIRRVDRCGNDTVVSCHNVPRGESRINVRTELETWNELASIDDDYHAQLLKAGTRRALGQGNGGSGYSVTVVSRQGGYQGYQGF